MERSFDSELDNLEAVINQANKSDLEFFEMIKMSSNSSLTSLISKINSQKSLVDQLCEAKTEIEIKQKLEEAKQIFAGNAPIIIEIEGLLNSLGIQSLKEFAKDSKNLISLLLKNTKELEEWLAETLNFMKEEREKALSYKKEELLAKQNNQTFQADFIAPRRDMMDEIRNQEAIRNKEFNDKINKLAAEFQDQREQINIQGQEINTLKNLLDEKSSEISTLQESVDQKAAEIMNLNAGIISLNVEMKKQSQKKDAEIISLNVEMKKQSQKKDAEIISLNLEMKKQSQKIENTWRTAFKYS